MMKKIFLVLAAVWISVAAVSAFEPAVVSGVWERKGSAEVVLYKVVSGRVEPMCSSLIQPDGSFGFAFNVPQEGFYTFGTGGPRIFMDKYTFYFKPGDRLAVKVDEFACEIIGTPSPENAAIAAWHAHINDFEFPSVYFFKTAETYKEIFPRLEKYAAEKYKAKSTGNKKFDETFAKYREYEFLHVADYFLHTPRTEHPAVELFPDYFRKIDAKRLLADDFLMGHPYGVDIMSAIVEMKHSLTRSAETTPLDEALAQAGSTQLKGELVLKHLAAAQSYDQVTEIVKNYNRHITTPDQRNRMAAALAKFAAERNKTGQEAMDFAGTDANGKQVKLSDFRGKMVLVDVWATWCGPCIAEIPHLKELIAHYEGKDVVFLGISIDEAKDHRKWVDFVKEKELGGVQIFGGNGWNSDVAKFYQITGIPRFMLFDKAGRVVASNAPRPSNPAIKTLIDNGLGE